MLPPKATGAHCDACVLNKGTCVLGRGELSAYDTARCVIVGEGPGATEVAHGQVFIGPSGALLDKLMEQYIVGSYWLTNTALCGVATPKTKEVASLSCCDRLFVELLTLRPKLIITLGAIPTARVLGHPVKITKARGITHSIRLHGKDVAVLPTFHPAAALRNPEFVASLVLDFKRAAEILIEEPLRCGVVDPSPKYSVTSDYKQVLQEAARSELPVLDLETASLDMETAKILCIVVATDKNIYIIPGEVCYTEGFKSALRECPAWWSGHNAKFDRNVMVHQLGVPVKFAFDTMLAHYVFDTRQGTHDLKHIAQERYAAPPWDIVIAEYLKKIKSKSYGDVPLDTLFKYAAYDGYYQRLLTRDLAAQLSHAPKQMELFTKLLMPGMHALSHAETQGVLLDREGLNALYPKYQQRIDEQQKRLVEIAGHDLNPRSTKQVPIVMFDELGIPEIEGRSTDARHVLKRYRKPHPFVTALLAYRAANTVMTRYLKGLDKHISPSGRVHSRYNLHRTATGRLSSAEPNLQNQPSRDPALKKDIKDLFMADPGMLWSDCDFAQIEYKMIALLSNDPYLIESYRAGKDLHAEMARDAWGDDYTKADRAQAKGLNFGLLYGRSVEGIMNDGELNLPASLAHQIARNFYAKMPGVVRYNKKVRQEVRRTGFVESMNGRIRKFYGVLIAHSRGDWNRIFREAVNTLPQGMASDATLYSIIRLVDAGFDVRLTVHDSISVQGPAEDITEICHEQMRIMSESATELYGDVVPYPTDGQVGSRWGTLKEIA